MTVAYGADAQSHLKVNAKSENTVVSEAGQSRVLSEAVRRSLPLQCEAVDTKWEKGLLMLFVQRPTQSQCMTPSFPGNNGICYLFAPPGARSVRD